MNRGIGITPLILLALLTALLVSCESKRKEPLLNRPILVEVAPVRQGTIAKELKFTGSIEAHSEVKVFPKITAQIEAMEVDVGDPIKKGDVITVLESDELRAQLAQVEAALEVMEANWAQMKVGARAEELAQAEDAVAKARANLKDAENNYQRMRALLDQGTIARRQFEAAELAYTVAKADLNSALNRLDMLREGATKEDREAQEAQVSQARAALDLARIRLSHTRITSPISGTVSERFFDPGDLAAPGKALVTIVQMDTVKVIIYFPENQIRYVVPGIRAELAVASYPDQTFSGTIDTVSPTLNPQTRMLSAEIRVRNEKHLLRPGMFATVTLSVDPHLNALLVPKEAVLYTEEYQENPGDNNATMSRISYLYVVEGDRAYLRRVSLGHESGTVVEVSEGVKEGEHVVVRGLHQLNNGDRITVAKVR